VGCCYWSVLGLFLGNDNNGVAFSLGSVPRWYFLWGPFRGYISLLASGVVTKYKRLKLGGGQAYDRSND
jgi:hypothetical protein